MLVPAREALRWEARYFPTRIVDNPFSGDPRPELDQAWHDLLRSMFARICRSDVLINSFVLDDNIRVSRSDLDALNLTSVYVRDGSDGIASLSVYHALHCLVCILVIQAGSMAALTGFTEKSPTHDVQRVLSSRE